MNLIYLLSHLAFDSIVIMFAIIFGAIPGKWYKKKIDQLQLVFATISFLSGTLSCILAKINEEFLLEINTLYTFSFLLLIEYFYIVTFLASIYKIKTKNRIGNYQNIQLRSSEYQLSNELEYTIGDSMIYMPNVKTCAVTENYIIVFPGPRPEKEIDADFLCEKIGDKTYACQAYTILEKEHKIKRIINYGINCFIVLTFLSIPLLFQHMDTTFMTTGNTDEFDFLFRFVMLFLFGALSNKLFKNTKGFGKILYYLSIVMIILSINPIIKFFI